MAPSQEVDLRVRSVKATGWRKDFVEFEYTVGDPLLTVELIMAPREFFAFCMQEQASITAVPAMAASLRSRAEAPAGIPIRSIEDTQERPSDDA